ncbi:kelch-like protein 3 [Zootermopsis nevadensis]|uniref:kelch-like protein 3 n=1 Tax=Zootermopsis nevadensis TaxID=136037 RepID=UPI000B8E788D|nr:kelch-like protein 3 [Zootermopsis nevadensis]
MREVAPSLNCHKTALVTAIYSSPGPSQLQDVTWDPDANTKATTQAQVPFRFLERQPPKEMESNQSGSRSQDGDRCTCTKPLILLNELREKNVLCDAVLRLEDGGVFPVHRVILSMRSEYFRTLFTTTLHTGEKTDILLHGISSDVMTRILDLSQQSKELLELPVEELQAIIESEELVVEDEKVVWECILRWINHDSDNRKGHIADLLKGVRLGLLDAKFFEEKVSIPLDVYGK